MMWINLARIFAEQKSKSGTQHFLLLRCNNELSDNGCAIVQSYISGQNVFLIAD